MSTVPNSPTTRRWPSGVVPTVNFYRRVVHALHVESGRTACGQRELGYDVLATTDDCPPVCMHSARHLAALIDEGDDE